jgi:hypothetical protein
MIRICLFQEKEMEVGERRSQLGGQWKILLLGGQWKVPLLSGQWKEKEKHLFTSSHFPPNKFYSNFQFFPLILRFYFTMVLSRYLRIPSFSLICKFQARMSM